MKKNIIVSGINLFEGGPLSVYKDFLNAAVDNGYHEKYNITCFVHKKSLFNEFEDKVEFIEFPKSRKSYFYRLYYEYFYFKKYSKNKDVYIWLSLHDITPRVKTTKQFTYCHNPSPFHKTSIKNIKYSFKTVMFSFFYKWLYRINISKNTNVIVQQNWIRDEFEKMYRIKNVIVSRPTFKISNKINNDILNNKIFQFIYPVYPRYFKNFEVICKACEIVEKSNSANFKVVFTIDGTENRYSKMLKRKYGHLKSIDWIGLQSRESVFELYNKSNALIFSSKLETWGLPISEFKLTERPIIFSDLPYSYETLGTYEKGISFDFNNPNELANIIVNTVNGTQKYKKYVEEEVDDPFYENWKDLLNHIFLEEAVDWYGSRKKQASN